MSEETTPAAGTFDLVIRGQRILTTAGITAREVGIRGGVIAAITTVPARSSAREMVGGSPVPRSGTDAAGCGGAGCGGAGRGGAGRGGSVPIGSARAVPVGRYPGT